MRIATWNINSVRLRINKVAEFAKANNPDIICLQETKVVDDLFPLKAVLEMGYPHIAINGMKSYNGVAILSRFPLKNVQLNIAPLETDVWSHKQLLKVVSHTPVEVDKLRKVQHTLNWTDAVRHFIPEDETLFSWWSYRARDWDKSDRGRRLDHVWVTPPLKNRLKSATVLRAARGGEKPSDHVPVIVDFEL